MMVVYGLQHLRTPELLNEIPLKQWRAAHPPIKSPAGEIRVIEGALKQAQSFSFVSSRLSGRDFHKLIRQTEALCRDEDRLKMRFSG